MSGLFSRLVQQHINQTTSSIKPVQSPVFPMQINEYNVVVNDVDKEQILPHRHIKAGAQIKNTETVISDYLGTSVSNTTEKNEQGRNETDAARLKINTSVNPLLTPVINSDINESTADEVTTPLSINSRLTPEVKPSIQPQLPGMTDSLQIPFVFNDDKENSFSTIEDTNFLPENNSIPQQSFNIYQTRPSSEKNRKVRSTQKHTQQIDDENQTTINISIGQIDIKATQVETTEKKTSTPSNQTRTSALEQYQQKRMRGER